MVERRAAASGWPFGFGSRCLLLVAALAGLFAMHGVHDHGLSDHGVGGSAAFVHAHVAAHGAVDLPTPVVTTVAGSAHLPGGPAGGACLAVLGLGLLLLAVRRIPTRAVSSRARPGDGRVVPARARAPDPPDLRRLCVQRC